MEQESSAALQVIQVPQTEPPRVPGGVAFSPRTLPEAMEFAKIVASSDLVPKDYHGKPANVLVAIQWGYELGLHPLQALQNIAVINGRPAVYGDAMLALVKVSPVCEYVRESWQGEGDDLTAVCEAKRRGHPVCRWEFGIADAKRAGLWGKAGPWMQYWKRMLQMRARGFALRDAFPDVLKGLIAAEEAMDCPASELPPEPPAAQPTVAVLAAQPELAQSAPAKPAPAPAPQPTFAAEANGYKCANPGCQRALTKARALISERQCEGKVLCPACDRLWRDGALDLSVPSGATVAEAEVVADPFGEAAGQEYEPGADG